LNKLWKLNLSTEELVDMAAALGSDVPYFIRGGTALAEGRGERVTPLPPLPQSWVVLLKPSVAVPASKTKAMYGALRPSHYSKGRHAKKVKKAIEDGVAGDGLSLHNAFDSVALDMYEGMEWYWNKFISAGADEAHLAGAGPTLFALMHDRARAGKVHRSLKELGLETYLVETVSRAD
jgi:4-diphosphocytidyl-2-C-methyl-D-erythritol kinase